MRVPGFDAFQLCGGHVVREAIAKSCPVRTDESSLVPEARGFSEWVAADDLRSMLRQLAEEVARDRFAEERPAACRVVKREPDSMQLGILARVEALAAEIEVAKSEAKGLVRKQVEESLCAAWGGVRLSKSRDPRGSVVHVVEFGDVRFPVDSWRTLCGWHFGRSACTRVPRTEADCVSCRETVHGRGEQWGGAAGEPW